MSFVAAPSSIAILGAGITGLTAAHRLHQLGHHVRVFDRADRVGGAIRTEQHDDWLVESGPNSLLSGEPALENLINELGLTSDRVAAAPAAKNRYIVRDGQVIPLPLSPPALLGSRLFSTAAKLRLFSEILSRRRVRTTDVSLAEFIGSHFGREFVDYALNPFVTGVYAGDPQKLSARHAFPKLWEIEQQHGSLVRGQIAAAKRRRARGEAPPRIFSFRRGLQTLVHSLALRLPSQTLTLKATLDTIVPGEKWSVIWHEADGTHSQSFDSIVVTLPGHALAQLQVGTHGERPLAALAAMEYPAVASLFLGFRREQVAHPLDGFGVLMPAIEKRSTLGVLFSSTLFPGRAPEGHVALTVLVGGARNPDLAALEPEPLLARVRTDLATLLGVSGNPVFLSHTRWPRAIPQYNLGYEQFLTAISATERAHPGLFIGGHVRDGISVPACIAAGEALAARVTHPR